MTVPALRLRFDKLSADTAILRAIQIFLPT